LGFIASLVVRKRWFSLAGLFIGTLGIILGSLLKNAWVAGASILIAGALALIQIPLAVRHDLRAIKSADDHQNP